MGREINVIESQMRKTIAAYSNTDKARVANLKEAEDLRKMHGELAEKQSTLYEERQKFIESLRRAEYAIAGAEKEKEGVNTQQKQLLDDKEKEEAKLKQAQEKISAIERQCDADLAEKNDEKETRTQQINDITKTDLPKKASEIKEANKQRQTIATEFQQKIESQTSELATLHQQQQTNLTELASTQQQHQQLTQESGMLDTAKKVLDHRIEGLAATLGTLEPQLNELKEKTIPKVQEKIREENSKAEDLKPQIDKHQIDYNIKANLAAHERANLDALKAEEAKLKSGLSGVNFVLAGEYIKKGWSLFKQGITKGTALAWWAAKKLGRGDPGVRPDIEISAADIDEKIDQFKQHQTSYEAEIAAKHAEVITAAGEFNTANNKAKEAKTTLTTAQKELKTAERESKTLTAKLGKLSTQRDVLVSKIEETEQQHLAALQQSDQLTTQITQKKQALSETEQSINQLTTQREQLATKISGAQVVLEALKTQRGEADQAQLAILNQLDQEKADLESRLAWCQGETGKIDQAISEISEQADTNIAQQRELIEQSTTSVAEMNGKLAEIGSREQELDQMIEKQTNIRDGLRLDIVPLNAPLESVEQQLDKNTKKLVENETKHNGYISRLDFLFQQKEKLAAERDQVVLEQQQQLASQAQVQQQPTLSISTTPPVVPRTTPRATLTGAAAAAATANLTRPTLESAIYHTSAGSEIMESQDELSVQTDPTQASSKRGGLTAIQSDAMALTALAVEKGIGAPGAIPLQLESTNVEMLEAAILTAKVLNIKPEQIKVPANCGVDVQEVYNRPYQPHELPGAIKYHVQNEKETVIQSMQKQPTLSISNTN